MTQDSYIGLIFLSRRIDFEAVMLLHSNVITRIQFIPKVLSRDLPNTKLKFLVPLSIVDIVTRVVLYGNVIIHLKNSILDLKMYHLS